MKNPDLFHEWRDYVLEYSYSKDEFPEFERSSLWKNLQIENEERAWLFIERNYLDRYRMIVAVAPDYAATGIWENSWPDGGAACEIAFEDLDLPQEVCDKLQEWQDFFDKYSPINDESEDPCDHDKWDAWGLAVAKEVKRFAPPDVYVEFHPFRELALVNGEVVELDVPEFIRGLCGIE